MSEPSIAELCAPISAKVAPRSAGFSTNHVPLTDKQIRTSQLKAESSRAHHAQKRRAAMAEARKPPARVTPKQLTGHLTISGFISRTHIYREKERQRFSAADEIDLLRRELAQAQRAKGS